MPSRVLVLFAHPALEKSRVNKVLVKHAQEQDGITFHDLYEAYPDFAIDVKREQTLLVSHDIVVFHHPMFWYSTPAILKEWQDLVLEHGWAYGHEGTALRGKTLFQALTTGGREKAYQHHGYHEHTLRELLLPVEQTALLCGMEYLPPFAVHGTHGMHEDEIWRHGRDYGRLLEAFREGRVDLDRARKAVRLNADLDRIVRD